MGRLHSSAIVTAAAVWVDKMTCIEISRPGGPEVLVPVERPDPIPGPNEVLIRVAGAGVNRPDVLQRRGAYAPPPGASDIPGLEVSGTITALGAGVREWKVHDTVCALVAGGGYATMCVAPAKQCLPVPVSVDLVSAGAIPETFFTVWTNVFDRGRLRSGETVLIHGGSSGIGTTAIQLAAARGATVLATAGSDEKCRACEDLGAKQAINYRTADFVDAVRELTSEKGVDLILDIVGGSYVARNLQALAMDGRLVQIGFMDGESTTPVDFRRIMSRRLTITGSLLRPRTVDEKGQIAAAMRTEVWPLLDRGVVKPVIHRVFPLADASEAHRLMESSEHVGKIVLTA
jgi:NADPH:quinone reductase